MYYFALNIDKKRKSLPVSEKEMHFMGLAFTQKIETERNETSCKCFIFYKY